MQNLKKLESGLWEAADWARTLGARSFFHGQEKNDLALRLALMNLVVHGLEGTIQKGNTCDDSLP